MFISYKNTVAHAGKDRNMLSNYFTFYKVQVMFYFSNIEDCII